MGFNRFSIHFFDKILLFTEHGIKAHIHKYMICKSILVYPIDGSIFQQLSQSVR